MLSTIKDSGNNDGLMESLIADDDICEKLASMTQIPRDLDLQAAKVLLKDTPIFSLTEFGRTVHAEMDALLSCARSGRSPAWVQPSNVQGCQWTSSRIWIVRMLLLNV